MKLIIMRHSIRDDMSNLKTYKNCRNNNCPISDEGRMIIYDKSRYMYLKLISYIYIYI